MALHIIHVMKERCRAGTDTKRFFQATLLPLLFQKPSSSGFHFSIHPGFNQPTLFYLLRF